MSKVIGLIPIKMHNQRLPGKNIKPLGDKVLCQYLFETASQIKLFDKVYVFCSDESICKYLPKEIEYLKRSPELDSDSTKSADIIKTFIETVDADIYALMHVTQPFIKKSNIEDVIQKVMDENYDSGFVVNRIKEFAWFQGQPINYSFENVVRTQELEPIDIEGELFVFKKEVFTQYGRRIGKNPYIKPISWEESICIDDIDDFNMAEAAIMLKKGSES